MSVFIVLPPPIGGGTEGGVEIVAGGHKLSESDIENLPNKHTRAAGRGTHFCPTCQK